MSTVPAAAPQAPHELRLDVEGMSCASCAAHVEQSLNALPGVEATVNLASEQASVRCAPGVALDALLAAVEDAGYRARPAGPTPGAQTAPARAPLAARLAVAVAGAVPVALLGMVPALRFDGWDWVSLGLATPVVLGAGLGFHRSALASLRRGRATMDTLVSLGTLAAWLWSTVVLAAGLAAHTYFEVAVVITALVLLGRELEARAKRRSADAVRTLLELGATEACILRDGEELLVSANELTPGDLFVVRPGERVATDGTVVEGASEIDGSLVTGEAEPVAVGPGAEVTGATVNGAGRLVVRATRVGADTVLAQIARLVEAAQSGKAPVQRLADRVSAVFVPAVLAVALATLAGRLALGSAAGAAFTAAVAVLVVACPCALGLATPTALAVGTGRGARLGLLIRGPQILEQTRRVDTIVLDKTGTVTEGALELDGVTALDGATRAEVLRLAGALEAASEHPVGRAVARAARAELGSLPPVDGFRSTPGVGVSGRVEGHDVVVGRSDGRIEVAWDGVPHATLAVRGRVKPESAEAVRLLERLGLEPLLLSGDTAEAAERVAREVGIRRVLAGVSPAGKAEEIRRLQEGGRVVAMVGDGVNDAPAFAQADLGIAVGTGADVAIEAANLTLVSGDLRGAADAIRLARVTLRTIETNLLWAFAYNAAAIPLAVAGLLNPMVAAAAMSCSSLLVVGNSLRLRRFRRAR